MQRPSSLRTLLLRLLVLGCLLFALPASADTIGSGKRLGIGLGGGTSTSGLTVKYYVANHQAIQAFAGLHRGYGNSIGVDYILEFNDLAKGSPGRLYWGAGAGAGLLLYSYGKDSASIIGISGVVQLGWHFNAFPLEIIADWRPTFWIGDYYGGINLSGGGGAIRWFF